LKRERDNNRLTRDKPGGCTPTREGQCVHEVLQWSTISLKAGDGEPCGSKGASVIEVLETTEEPENGHIGIEASAPTKRTGSITQLKCIFINAHSMGNKQEEL